MKQFMAKFGLLTFVRPGSLAIERIFYFPLSLLHRERVMYIDKEAQPCQGCYRWVYGMGGCGRGVGAIVYSDF